MVRGELALDTLHYYTSDSPSLPAARERALRLGWQGVYLRWLGSTLPVAVRGRRSASTATPTAPTRTCARSTSPASPKTRVSGETSSRR